MPTDNKDDMNGPLVDEMTIKIKIKKEAKFLNSKLHISQSFYSMLPPSRS